MSCRPNNWVMSVTKNLDLQCMKYWQNYMLEYLLVFSYLKYTYLANILVSFEIKKKKVFNPMLTKMATFCDIGYVTVLCSYPQIHNTTLTLRLTATCQCTIVQINKWVQIQRILADSFYQVES